MKVEFLLSSHELTFETQMTNYMKYSYLNIII
jgi:hypothetical protein